MSTIQHKKGRPSRAERIQIRKDLEPYYGKIPAYKAAEITGYDTKTVNKYYEQFYREIHGHEIKNFAEREEKEKIRHGITLEILIRKLHNILEHVENSIQKLKDAGEVIPSHLIQNYSKILTDISRLSEQRLSLSMLPGADDLIEESVDEKIGGHA